MLPFLIKKKKNGSKKKNPYMWLTHNTKLADLYTLTSLYSLIIDMYW